MEISNPQRILALSQPDSGLIQLIGALTGTAPSFSEGTIAGSTHIWSLKTAYYTAKIPIWLDEVVDPSQWAKEFLAPEAREVLTVLGAFIVSFPKPVNDQDLKNIRTLLRHVSEVVKEGCGFSWDGVCLAVAMPQSTTPYLEKDSEEWEDLCGEFGFEFVDFEANGRNEFSEPLGLERLKEALEANDWGGSEAEDELDLDDDADEGFGLEAAEMEQEMSELKEAINGPESATMANSEDQDKEVEKLQQMMTKMQAVRDMGFSLPEAERKRLAAKAVNEVMKTL